MTVTTKNVAGLKLYPRDSWRGTVTIDGQKLTVRDDPQIGGIWLVRKDGQWSSGGFVAPRHKITGVTGPIDDAFMDGFLFVRPTGKALNEKIGSWTTQEIAHA